MSLRAGSPADVTQGPKLTRSRLMFQKIEAGALGCSRDHSVGLRVRLRESAYAPQHVEHAGQRAIVYHRVRPRNTIAAATSDASSQ